MATLSTLLIANNTLFQWLVFFGILVIAFYGTKILYWLFSRVFKFAVRKTKTRLDDLLVDALEKPILLLVLITGISYAKRALILSVDVAATYLQVVHIGYLIAITWFVVKFIDALLANYLLPYARSKSSKLDDTLFPVVKGVVNFVIYTVAVIFIIQQLGYEITGLLAGLGIGGLAFALAAQDILSNFFGGAAVITDKPFKVGDRIQIEGKDGYVRKIGMRTTHVETFDGTMVVLPNKTVASTVLENISAERARRTKFVLGVEYSTSTAKLKKAKELLTEIIKKNKKTENRSLVHFKGFNDSSLDIQVIYWIDDLENILATRDEINFAIKQAFEKAKIEFAYPSQTIYVKK